MAVIFKSLFTEMMPIYPYASFTNCVSDLDNIWTQDGLPEARANLIKSRSGVKSRIFYFFLEISACITQNYLWDIDYIFTQSGLYHGLAHFKVHLVAD